MAQLGSAPDCNSELDGSTYLSFQVKVQNSHLGMLFGWMAATQELKCADTFTASLKYAIDQIHSPSTGQSNGAEKFTPPTEQRTKKVKIQ